MPKTCRTCKAWGRNQPGAQSGVPWNWCHRSALVACLSGKHAQPVSEDWWCLDHVPLTDEQSVLDRVVERIESAIRWLGDNSDYTYAYRQSLAIIKEERNR